MKNYFLLCLLVVMSVFFTTGCNSKHEQTHEKKIKSFEAKSYRSGTVMLRDKSNSSNESSFDFGASMRDMEVGPGEVKFGPENEF